MTQKPADWLNWQRERRGKPPLTEPQGAAYTILSEALSPGRPYGIYYPCGAVDAVLATDYYLSLLYNGELATHDSDALTNLATAAHRHRRRINVQAWNPHRDPDRHRANAVARAINAINGAEFDSLTDARHAYATAEHNAEPILNGRCPELAAGILNITINVNDNDWCPHPGPQHLTARLEDNNDG